MFYLIYSINIVDIILPLFFIIIIVIFLYVIYKQYRDKNVILGIFASAFFYAISFINFSIFSHFLPFFYSTLFGFICGIPAGLFNKNLKVASLSGAIGVFLGPTLFYQFHYFIIITFESYYFVFKTIPLILGGALGGALGNRLLMNYKYRLHSIVSNNSKTEENNN
jgi:hypothetical protein